MTRHRKSTNLTLLKQKQTARNQSIKHVRRRRAHTVPHTLVWKHSPGRCSKKTVNQSRCTCIINVYQPAVLKYEYSMVGFVTIHQWKRQAACDAGPRRRCYRGPTDKRTPVRMLSLFLFTLAYSHALREETRLNTTAESWEKLSASILIGFRHKPGRLPLRGCVREDLALCNICCWCSSCQTVNPN